jgi:hypothetical protein
MFPVKTNRNSFLQSIEGYRVGRMMAGTPIDENERKLGARIFGGAVRAVWNAVRLPIAGAMLLLEPIVAFICGAGLVLGILVCILFEISAAGPRFPLFKALGISLSFGMILFLYYGLLSLLVSD